MLAQNTYIYFLYISIYALNSKNEITHKNINSLVIFIIIGI